MRVEHGAHQRTRDTAAGAALPPASACRRHLPVAVFVPRVVVNLRRDSRSAVIGARRHLQYAKGLAKESLFQIRDRDQVAWTNAQALYARIEFDIRIPAHRLVQVQLE